MLHLLYENPEPIHYSALKTFMLCNH